MTENGEGTLYPVGCVCACDGTGANGVGVLKNAIGSCRCCGGAGVGLGDGAENKSSGKPEDVDGADDAVGRASPPSPDMGSSSANASNEMRSAAF